MISLLHLKIWDFLIQSALVTTLTSLIYLLILKYTEVFFAKGEPSSSRSIRLCILVDGDICGGVFLSDRNKVELFHLIWRQLNIRCWLMVLRGVLWDGLNFRTLPPRKVGSFQVLWYDRLFCPVQYCVGRWCCPVIASVLPGVLQTLVSKVKAFIRNSPRHILSSVEVDINLAFRQCGLVKLPFFS